MNRFHWGISHYIGSQLRQCVLDPDGATLYAHDFPKRVPSNGRRLWPPSKALAGSGAGGGDGNGAGGGGGNGAGGGGGDGTCGVGGGGPLACEPAMLR